MKFSDLLGDPEPEPQSEVSEANAGPISVFAPEPIPPAGNVSELTDPPMPRPPASPVSRWADNVLSETTGRSGLAELNVRQPVGPPPPAAPGPDVSDQLEGLTEIVDDLLPSARRTRK